jgi:hypothetical protein
MGHTLTCLGQDTWAALFLSRDSFLFHGVEGLDDMVPFWVQRSWWEETCQLASTLLPSWGSLLPSLGVPPPCMWQSQVSQQTADSEIPDPTRRFILPAGRY